MGHRPAIARSYYKGNWHFNVDNQNLTLRHELSGGGSRVVGITANEVEYARDDAAGLVFKYGDRRIFVLPDGFRRVDVSGDWKLYDAAGKLVEYGDRHNRKVMLGYDAGGLVNALFDHFTNQIFWIERTAGQIVSVRDQATGGRQVAYWYDPAGNLTDVVDLLGANTVYRYDGNNRLVWKRNPSGKEAHVTYNPQGVVTSVMDEAGIGKFFEYGYDKVKEEYYSFVRTTEGNVYERWFDRNGAEIRRDVNGVATPTPPSDGTTYERDAAGNITRIVYADGATVTRSYAGAWNSLVQEVDELGVVTRYQYDAYGTLTNRIEAFGTDQERITQWVYDALGQLVRLTRKGDTNTLDAVTQWTYDQWGNQATVTDPEGYITTNTYDRLAHVVITTDAWTNTWWNAYDPAGHLLVKYTPMGYGTTNTYDLAGRLVASYDPYGLATRYEFDTSGRVVRQTDPYARVTTFAYDFEGRCIRRTDPDGNDSGSVYDARGHLLRKWPLTGQITHYTVRLRRAPGDTDGS